MDNFSSVLYGKDGDSHDTGIIARLKAIEDEKYDERIKAIEELVPFIKLIIGVGTILGLSVVALIWGLMTGTVSLVIP